MHTEGSKRLLKAAQGKPRVTAASKKLRFCAFGTNGRIMLLLFRCFFARDPREKPNAVSALNEPLIWEKRVKRESGQMKLEF
jgi:hypothetical protein